jgi:hypothetical protein
MQQTSINALLLWVLTSTSNSLINSSIVNNNNSSNDKKSNNDNNKANKPATNGGGIAEETSPKPSPMPTMGPALMPPGVKAIKLFFLFH